jgi:HD superfamily phosphodiesterase
MKDVKNEIAREMEAYFDGDNRRIDHAHKVTGYVEQLMTGEGGDYRIVVAAGLLHDIGIHVAEKKYHSTSGKYQEIEGPPIAREILTRLAFPETEIDEICQIIANHHSPGKINTRNFKILYDADWLVNLRDEYNIENQRKLRAVIGRVFLTSTGRSLAKEIYLGEKG